jgi:NAD(P)-dependent dehydrogenase (short-subunit alcohol dehydrogenase family)
VRLADKTALVTGATSGIGRALAVGLAAEGARVIVHHHDEPAAAADVLDELGPARGLFAVDCDLREPARIAAMFARVRREVGRLDVLANNAAVTGWTRLFDITEGAWDDVLHTNLRGAFFCCLEAARIMREHSGGSLVNVSTNCAALGVPNLVAYATSKGGIETLMRQLAVELAPYSIRVNAIAPGPTLVARNLADDPDYDRTWGEHVPLGRAARPEEMVGAAVFLASDESSYATGQVLGVDVWWTVAGRVPAGQMDAAARRAASRA